MISNQIRRKVLVMVPSKKEVNTGLVYRINIALLSNKEQNRRLVPRFY